MSCGGEEKITLVEHAICEKIFSSLTYEWVMGYYSGTTLSNPVLPHSSVRNDESYIAFEATMVERKLSR